MERRAAWLSRLNIALDRAVVANVLVFWLDLSATGLPYHAGGGHYPKLIHGVVVEGDPWNHRFQMAQMGFLLLCIVARLVAKVTRAPIDRDTATSEHRPGGSSGEEPAASAWLAGDREDVSPAVRPKGVIERHVDHGIFTEVFVVDDRGWTVKGRDLHLVDGSEVDRRDAKSRST